MTVTLDLAGHRLDGTKTAAAKTGSFVDEIAVAAAEAAKAATAKAGALIGEHAGTFLASAAEGAEKSVCDYEIVFEGPEAKELGLAVSLVRLVRGPGRDPAPELSLYLLNEKPVSGTLRARCLMADGREIGRGSAELRRDAADDAGYLRVPVPKDIPTELVSRLSLSITSAP